MAAIPKNRSFKSRLSCGMLMLSLGASLCACGTKGVLYLPEIKYPQGVPANTPGATTTPKQNTAPSPKTP